LHIYGKIYDYCQSKDCRSFTGGDIKTKIKETAIESERGLWRI